MGNHVAEVFIKEMKKKKIQIKGSKVLIMGLTFKENCADIRNSGVKTVIDALKKYDCNLNLYDPWVNNDEIEKLYGFSTESTLNHNTYDGIIIAVGHEKFKEMGETVILNLCKKNHIVYDLKYLFSKDQFSLRL